MGTDSFRLDPTWLIWVLRCHFYFRILKTIVESYKIICCDFHLPNECIYVNTTNPWPFKRAQIFWVPTEWLWYGVLSKFIKKNRTMKYMFQVFTHLYYLLTLDFMECFILSLDHLKNEPFKPQSHYMPYIIVNLSLVFFNYIHTLTRLISICDSFYTILRSMWWNLQM